MFKNIKKTKMLNRYMLSFLFRLMVFFFVFIFYLIDKQLMYKLMTFPIYMGFRPIHFIWLVFMIIMLMHVFPTEKLTMALLKAEDKHFKPVNDFSRLSLLEFVQNQNFKAWMVMLVWLFLNGTFGLLYLGKVIDEADLVMLSVFFFLCDYICILFFCPFQTFIMKNRCCVNCRIYDWGHFMMFTPMLFIRSFYSWSLFFTSLVVLITWELKYAKHPERFWSGSNKTIQCANCKDKTCQLKTALKNAVVK